MAKQKSGRSNSMVADSANGAQNVAANLAVSNAPEVTSNGNKRGRKASSNLTFAKFAAGIRSGTVPDGVHYVNQSVDPNSHIVTWGHWESDSPVLNLDENGNLQLIRLYTEGRGQKPAFEVLKTATPAEILNFLNSK